MSAIIICDGCGKQAPAVEGNYAWHKPHDWFERTDADTGKTYTACCRECVERVHLKQIMLGVASTNVVLPI